MSAHRRPWHSPVEPIADDLSSVLYENSDNFAYENIEFSQFDSCEETCLDDVVPDNSTPDTALKTSVSRGYQSGSPTTHGQSSCSQAVSDLSSVRIPASPTVSRGTLEHPPERVLHATPRQVDPNELLSSSILERRAPTSASPVSTEDEPGEYIVCLSGSPTTHGPSSDAAVYSNL